MPCWKTSELGKKIHIWQGQGENLGPLVPTATRVLVIVLQENASLALSAEWAWLCYLNARKHWVKTPPLFSDSPEKTCRKLRRRNSSNRGRTGIWLGWNWVRHWWTRPLEHGILLSRDVLQYLFMSFQLSFMLNKRTLDNWIHFCGPIILSRAWTLDGWTWHPAWTSRKCATIIEAKTCVLCWLGSTKNNSHANRI